MTSIEDLDQIAKGKIHDEVKRDIEDSMSFCQVAFHRMLLTNEDDENDTDAEEQKRDGDGGVVYPAGFHGVTQISSKVICSDENAKVYFERSGTRYWKKCPFAFSESTVPQAIAKLKSFLEPSTHKSNQT